MITVTNSLADFSDVALEDFAELIARTWHRRRISAAEFRTLALPDIAVVADGPRLIGFGALHTDYKVGLIKCSVEDVIVDEAYRRQGTATRILQRLIEDAKRRGADVVKLTSADDLTGAHQLYERNGFVRTGTAAFLRSLKPR